MLKYWRVLILLVCVIGAVLAIGMRERRYGVEITYIDKDSPAKGTLSQGMVVTTVNNADIASIDDWEKATASLSGDVRIMANDHEYFIFVNDSLGIEAEGLKRVNLDFGIDLRGGTRVILRPSKNATAEMIEQIIGTLQTRINIYGLREMKFYPVQSPDGWYVQIEAAGISSDVVEDLLTSRGQFEGRIIKPVYLQGDEGEMRLGDVTHRVSVANGTVYIDGSEANGTFTLDGIDFSPGNVTGNTVSFLATVYTGEDIELIYTDPQHSGLVPQGNSYRFYFTVLVSQAGSERFAKVTSGIPSQLDLDSGQYYLKDTSIDLYLDGRLQSSLRIGSSLGGKIYSTPQIEGGAPSLEEAVKERLTLQTILRSGSLPVGMEVSSISIISPTLGEGFIESSVLAALVAGLAVVIIVFIRYRNLRIALPMVVIGLSEVIIVLGMSASSPVDAGIWGAVLMVNLAIILYVWMKQKEVDISAWAGALLIPIMATVYPGSWTIDLPAIGGLIAAIGTGIDQMVVIADETSSGEKRKRSYTMKQKIAMAFFIIFTAAATTIAALIPLYFVTAGVFVRGFVTTTIAGVLTGILVTRPAYARIIEASEE